MARDQLPCCRFSEQTVYYIQSDCKPFSGNDPQGEFLISDLAISEGGLHQISHESDDSVIPSRLQPQTRRK
jgi:hypothetical protein